MTRPAAPRAAPADEEVRNRLVLDNLALVNHLVGRVAINLPPAVDRMDLFHAGVLGLIRAADSYRTDAGASFTTYAYTCVKGAILDELRRMDFLTRQQREKVTRLMEVRESLETSLGRPPSTLEIGQELGITVRETDEILLMARSMACISLDEALPEGRRRELRSLLRNPRAEDPADEASHRELKRRLVEAVAALPAAERHVIALYYDQGLLLREIAETLGVTESRVSQIHSRAILRLNEALRDRSEEIDDGEAAGPRRGRRRP